MQQGRGLKIVQVAILAAVMLVPAGCMTGKMQSNALGRSDFREYVRIHEEQHPDWYAEKNASVTLCQSYFFIRDYANYSRCAEVVLEKAVCNHPWRDEYVSCDGVDVPEYLRRRDTDADSYANDGFYINSVSEYLRLQYCDLDVAVELGEHDKARRIADTLATQMQRLEKHGRHHIRNPQESWWSLGNYYAGVGDEAKVRENIEKIKQHQEEYPNSNTVRYGKWARTNLLFSMHKYGEVRELLKDFRGPGDFDEVNSDAMEFLFRYMAAKACYETGDREAARASYEQLLKVERLASRPMFKAVVLADLADMEIEKGDDAMAMEHLAEAIDLAESQRVSIRSEFSKIHFVQARESMYGKMVLLLVRGGQAERALEYVERAKARAMVDMLASRNEVIAGNDSTTLALLERIDSLEHVAAVQAGKDSGGEATRSITLAVKGLAEHAPRAASLVAPAPFSNTDLRGQLAVNTALVEYYTSGDTLYVFTVEPGAVQVHTGSTQGLEQEVKALRKALLERGDWEGPSRRLHERLLAPAGRVLDAGQLIIVPHGPMHYLPFAALTDGQRFLVERTTLRILPSAAVALQLSAMPRQEGNDSMLILGNPDLGDSRFDLPGAEIEARKIHDAAPGARLLLRDKATETALKDAAGRYGVIHLATHGTFNSDNPMASALLLGADEANDGLLTTADIYGLRLNARLVTLSACETGLGEVMSGDDVIGLTRGFFYAGARSVAASLWPVSDEATSRLMASFYAGLAQGDTAQALRRAQLETMRDFPHPYYWSAFFITGI